MNADRTPSAARKIAVAVALAAATAVPLAVTTPAQAATTSSGCTVHPLTAVHAGFDSTGTKLVRYSVQVTCAANRTVTVQQERWEYDFDGPNDKIGASTLRKTFTAAGRVTLSVTERLPNLDSGSNEEIFQKVRFHVSSNGVTSAWTNWEARKYVSMPN